MATTLATVSCIVAWYTANIVLLLLNKFLLTGRTGFRGAACFLTLCHMAACVLCGGAAALCGVFPLGRIKSRSQAFRIGVLSCVFCGTIVLGNASLKFIPVSFNQAIGATTPFFTAVLAFSIQGNRESPLTYATLVPIVAGIAIACGGEPMFHMLGFSFAILATAGRAFKTVVQSLLMMDQSEKLDPMSLLMYMSCYCCALLLPVTMLLEPGAMGQAWALATTSQSFAVWIVSNSLLAYFVNLFNFLVTKLTSPLTLQVLGNAKGVVAAAVSVAVFGNPVTAMGALGYGITMAGVVLYSEVKRRSKAAAAAAAAVKQAVEEMEAQHTAATSVVSDKAHQHAGPNTATPRVSAMACGGDVGTEPLHAVRAHLHAEITFKSPKTWAFSNPATPRRPTIHA